MNIERKIYETILRLKNVTFAELIQYVPEVDAKDDETGQILQMPIDGEPSNIYYWAHLSPIAAEAIEKLLNEEKIVLKEAHPLIYMTDSWVLDLPIAKQRRKYKSPRWLPVLLNIGA